MKKIIYISLFAFCTLVSCKKTYQCECKNTNGTYIAGETEGTHHQAKKYCESLSTGATSCNIK